RGREGSSAASSSQAEISATRAKCANVRAWIKNVAAMRISLVIPNYNSGPVLERAIRSILEQQYSDLELIVVDSMSTDESKDTIDKYRAQLSHLVRAKDRGPADGINKGFARATGDIYAWLGADDELAPDTFHTVVNIFKEHPEADIVI